MMEDKNQQAEKQQPEKDDQWSREMLFKLAHAGLEEQRRSRRWGIFFKLMGLAYLIALLLVVISPKLTETQLPTGGHTAVVELSGIIAPDSEASAENVIAGLRAAFKDKGTKGVVLRINSPGGSPVQSGYIYDEIRRLRDAHPQIPLYAVVTDICASGGYYVAAAADEIYANKASIVGSIGVRMDSFGFVDAIDKMGIERRLLTAGENKALNDPFLPVEPEQQAHLQKMLDDIHQQFISVVRQGRGERLADDPALFSGLIWTGEEAVEKGLVDGLGSTRYVAREVIGQERLVDFTPEEDFFQRISRRVGQAMAQSLVQLNGGMRLQ